MEKAFNLYLVRHGESYNNSVPQSQRVCDPPLTALGQAQAQRLAERIRQQFAHQDSSISGGGRQTAMSNNGPDNPQALDSVYTSAFLRTMQTIHPTTQITNVLPDIWTDLFEVGGCFNGYLPGQTQGMPGMTNAEIAQQFAGYTIPDDIDDQGWWKSKPRETPDLAEIRTEKVIQQLLNRYYGKNATVLCVIHGDLIRMLMRNLVPHQPIYGTDVTHNTSVTHLRFSTNRTAISNDEISPTPEVLLFNDTAHLSENMLSV